MEKQIQFNVPQILNPQAAASIQIRGYRVHGVHLVAHYVAFDTDGKQCDEREHAMSGAEVEALIKAAEPQVLALLLADKFKVQGSIIARPEPTPAPAPEEEFEAEAAPE